MKTRLIRGGALYACVIACVLAANAGRVETQSSLPSGWSSRDIGSTGVAGSSSVSSGTWTVRGSGANIWGSADELQFAYQQITGDFDISVRLSSLQNVDPWAKAGLMVRDSLNANAKNAFMMVVPKGTKYFQYRASTGGSTTRGGAISGTLPVWLRIVRQSSKFTGYVSSNGSTWTPAGSATISMASAAYVGLAVSSRVDSRLATAVFSNFQQSTSGGGSTTGLPAPWTNRDLGSPTIPGAASAAAGTFTVSGAGQDIWGSADQFHYVYQQLSGDVEVIARVASFQYSYSWSKAGVMVRESLAANSRHIAMVASGTMGWSVPRRAETGGSTQSSPYLASASGAAPGWVRLVRQGNVFSAYRSSDGVNWTMLISDTIVMSPTVYVGLAVGSVNASAAATATFTNVTARSYTTGSNSKPSVAITAPLTGATYTAGATMVLTAAASDTDGTITKVDLYQGSQLLKSDTTSPYSVSVTLSTSGTYSFTAVATDSDGDTATSAPVSVTVGGTTNQPPTVSLTSPSSGATYTAPASVTMSATASDSDGTVSRVDFYQGSTLLFSDTSSPYGYTWSNVPAGSYSISAIARDDDGATRTSSTASITVNSATNQAPSVALTAPSANATFTAGANITLSATASDSDGTVARVEFYRGTTLIGTDTTSPYSVVWSGAAAGSYSLTAKAFDNAGASRTSTAVAITVGAASTPTTLVFTASADHATNVSSYTVAIYRSADPVTGSPVATRDLGKPTPSNGDISVNISTLVDPLPAGTYKAVVRALGPGGTTASTPSSNFTK